MRSRTALPCSGPSEKGFEDQRQVELFVHGNQPLLDHLGMYARGPLDCQGKGFHVSLRPMTIDCSRAGIADDRGAAGTKGSVARCVTGGHPVRARVPAPAEANSL